jgi:hypothetical protein
VRYDICYWKFNLDTGASIFFRSVYTYVENKRTKPRLSTETDQRRLSRYGRVSIELRVYSRVSEVPLKAVEQTPVRVSSHIATVLM